LKNCEEEIRRPKIQLKNLPLSMENLLPFTSGQIPAFLCLISTGQTGVRESLRVLLSCSCKRAFRLLRLGSGQPNLSFKIMKAASIPGGRNRLPRVVKLPQNLARLVYPACSRIKDAGIQQIVDLQAGAWHLQDKIRLKLCLS